MTTTYKSSPFRYLALLLSITALLTVGCKKYLDIVPDNLATLDNAFANRVEAEKYLFTCYSYLPWEGDPDRNPAFSGADEAWTYWPMTRDYFFLDPYQIARGEQNSNSPFLNYWDDVAGKSLWQGIRVCNIFLENVGSVADLDPYMRDRWTAEAKFLKAYYHWWLFRMYGPIPIMDKNLPTTATPNEMKVYRQPVDSCINYIVNLMDEVSAGDGNSGLPISITSTSTELGRITKVAVAAIKARVLVTAASPLFNGNNDFGGLKNPVGEGTPLFNTQYDPSKWTRAAAACKQAIDLAASAGNRLYYFNTNLVQVSPAQQTEMNIRNAICEKWNKELIWGATTGGNPTYWIQLFACPNLDPNTNNLDLKGKLAPPISMAELFYTKNGVPIEEDKTWDYNGRYNLRTASATDTGLQTGYQTVKLHFDRERRFYADMAFDGATWFMRNGNYNIQSKAGQYSGKRQSINYSVTGYYIKKIVNWNLVYSNTDVTVESYPWPIIRLGDLYLLYAEALNESGNGAQALSWLNSIRARAGLSSVEFSWSNFSNQPAKYTNTNGLREIIRRERLIELAFEGSRFWDLRRWKTAPQVLSQPIYGWDVSQSTTEDYNRRILLYSPRFIAPRDYLWPIREYNLQVNPNLVQNAGW